jgi:adenylate kinase family enzyme
VEQWFIMSETFDEQRRSSALLKRIVVVGVSGAGKTTLAQHLALHLDIPHVELDALFWEPNWTPVSPEIFRERVAQALCSDHWVTDGNFSQVRDLTWGRATTVIWLDYGVRTMLMRLVHRAFLRIVTREALWNGNRETFLQSLFTRESIIVWALKTYQEKRRRYLAAQVDPAYAHLEIIRLRTPLETQVWLSRLAILSHAADL